jgi:hypothetical protein
VLAWTPLQPHQIPFHRPSRPLRPSEGRAKSKNSVQIRTRCCCFSALTGEAFGSAVSFFLFFFFYSCLKKEFGCLAQLVLITLCTGYKIACVINF